MKLDRELTEKFFSCKSAEEVAKVVSEAEAAGKNLESASRISIDEVLNKFYHKRCTGTKSHAVTMLKGAIIGQDVPDVSLTPTVSTAPRMTLDQYAKELSAEGDERIALLKEALEEAMNNQKKYYEYTDKILERNPRLRALRATDAEMAEIGKTSLVFVAGKAQDGRYYLMKREPKRMEDAVKFKWDLIL